jgi:hypothetical protein
MGFTSALGRTEPIINDETSNKEIENLTSEDRPRGLDLSMRGPGPYEYGPYASPFPNDLLIPRSEWQARIQEMEETKSRISDLIRHKNLPHKDQGRTNYCWINAPVHCVEIVRLQQNQPMVSLSPASAGGPIKNFRNVGGWGLEGLKWLIEHGCVPSSLWPDNAIDRRYYTESNRQVALKYRVDEWVECRPRTIDQMISMLLRRIPGAGGYNWWRHEVTNVDPVWIDGDAAVRIRNSWRGWGDNGFGILQGSKMLADDLVFPISALPTTEPNRN